MICWTTQLEISHELNKFEDAVIGRSLIFSFQVVNIPWHHLASHPHAVAPAAVPCDLKLQAQWKGTLAEDVIQVIFPMS